MCLQCSDTSECVSGIDPALNNLAPAVSDSFSRENLALAIQSNAVQYKLWGPWKIGWLFKSEVRVESYIKGE